MAKVRAEAPSGQWPGGRAQVSSRELRQRSQGARDPKERAWSEWTGTGHRSPLQTETFSVTKCSQKGRQTPREKQCFSEEKGQREEACVSWSGASLSWDTAPSLDRGDQETTLDSSALLSGVTAGSRTPHQG